MKKLSTGMDSTLENWITLSKAIFGEDSKAVAFLVDKAEKSPNGVNEEVIANEEQLLLALVSMN